MLTPGKYRLRSGNREIVRKHFPDFTYFYSYDLFDVIECKPARRKFLLVLDQEGFNVTIRTDAHEGTTFVPERFIDLFEEVKEKPNVMREAMNAHEMLVEHLNKMHPNLEENVYYIADSTVALINAGRLRHSAPFSFLLNILFKARREGKEVHFSNALTNQHVGTLVLDDAIVYLARSFKIDLPDRKTILQLTVEDIRFMIENAPEKDLDAVLALRDVKGPVLFTVENTDWYSIYDHHRNFVCRVYNKNLINRYLGV